MVKKINAKTIASEIPPVYPKQYRDDSEIIEDGALGKKVKEGNFKMRMVRGESYNY